MARIKNHKIQARNKTNAKALLTKCLKALCVKPKLRFVPRLRTSKHVWHGQTFLESPPAPPETRCLPGARAQLLPCLSEGLSLGWMCLVVKRLCLNIGGTPQHRRVFLMASLSFKPKEEYPQNMRHVSQHGKLLQKHENQPSWLDIGHVPWANSTGGLTIFPSNHSCLSQPKTWSQTQSRPKTTQLP